MLRKSQEEPKESKTSTNRNKLPQEQSIRSLSGIKDLLAMARESRGSQIELEWTTNNAGQVFVLDVQWDSGQNEPFWSLYEQNGGKSKVLLNQFFNPNDIDMFYDILVMSCGAVDHSSKKLSDILKAQPEKMDWSKSADNKSATEPSPTPAQSPAPVAVPAPPPLPVMPALTPAQVSTSAPVSTPAMPNQSLETTPNPNPNPGFVPPYGFPPGMGLPINPAMYNMQGYNIAAPMQGIPIVYPPSMNPTVNQNQANLNQGFTAAPELVPPGWQFPPPGSNLTSGGNSNLYGQQVPDPKGALSGLPIDAALVNKTSDIDLLDLLIRAQLQTQPIIAAALKIQDLIRENKISMEKGSEVLSRHYRKGEAIGNYINGPIDSSSSSVDAPSGTAKPSIQDQVISEVKSKQEDKATLAAFELLKKAGLLSPDDIKTAEGVRHKHGGDIVSILQAAQKIDSNTLEAAKICQVLEKEGAMKLEQCVIVLNYCIRSRVSFDEAIGELNWPNPRHLKK